MAGDGDGDDAAIGPGADLVGELLREAEGEAAARADPLTPALRSWMTKVDAARVPRPGIPPRAGGPPAPRPGPAPRPAEGPAPPEWPAPTPAPPPDPETAIPRPGDPYDKAYARPAARPVPSLCLVLADGTRRSFPSTGRAGGPDLLETPRGQQLIVLRYNDVVPREIELAGARLDELYELLCYQTVAWVRARPPGTPIRDPTRPVVTAILVRRWKPEPGE